MSSATPEISNEFTEQLRKQLGFLERSANSYDHGDEDEAVRIATSLRVLFHDTESSTSLMRHLGVRNLRLHSTCTLFSKRQGGPALARIQIDLQKGTVRSIPFLGDSPERRTISFDRWWRKDVIARISGQDFTRRSVILWAANKDGGAHVDQKIPVSYRALATLNGTGFQVGEPWIDCPLSAGARVSCWNGHYACLRQMAFEVLSSQDILNLAAVPG